MIYWIWYDMWAYSCQPVEGSVGVGMRWRVAQSCQPIEDSIGGMRWWAVHVLASPHGSWLSSDRKHVCTLGQICTILTVHCIEYDFCTCIDLFGETVSFILFNLRSSVLLEVLTDLVGCLPYCDMWSYICVVNYFLGWYFLSAGCSIGGWSW